MVDEAIPRISPIHQAQGQLSNAPIVTSIATDSTTSCGKIRIAGIRASSDTLNALNVLDNNLNSAWSRNARGSWIQFDLGGQKTICSMDIAWYHGNQVKYDFTISVSSDGTTFADVFTGKSSGATLGFETYFLHGSTTGRYMRVTVNGNNNNNSSASSIAAIAELSVYGFSIAPSLPPTADNKNIETNTGTPVQITLTGTDSVSVDTLKFSVVSLPQHGSLAHSTALNSVIYTPKSGFSGTDSFQYKATNGQGADSNMSTVAINVKASSPTAPDVETIQATPGSSVWSGFSSLGGNILGDPGSTRNSDGRLEVL